MNILKNTHGGRDLDLRSGIIKLDAASMPPVSAQLNNDIRWNLFIGFISHSYFLLYKQLIIFRVILISTFLVLNNTIMGVALLPLFPIFDRTQVALRVLMSC